MWALRRASINLRNRCLSSCTVRIYSLESEVVICYLENRNREFSQSQRFHSTQSCSASLSIVQSFSSLAGANRSVETRHDTIEKSDESVSEPDFSVGVGDADDVENELHISDTVSDVGEEISSETELIKAVLSASLEEVCSVFDGWVEGGNEVTRTDLSRLFITLYRRRMFDKALQVSEWLESRKYHEFTEDDYARHVYLVAKVRGTFPAEEYFQKVPESFRRETVYASLLKSYVAASNVHKSEQIFNSMKNLFPLTCLSCNQLLFLYKKTNRRKIADVLSLMKSENIKPSNVTLQILIDVKWKSEDISGMGQLFGAMKSDGVEPSPRNLASLARHYAARGRKAKAETILKDMEGGDLVKNRHACRFLLPAYAALGRDDEVERIWKECESNPQIGECVAAVRAWGALKRIEDAEAAFDKILKTLDSPISKHYVVLLDVYADHKMLDRGEDLLQRMTEGGIVVGGPAWDAIVKLYVGVGEVEKANAILLDRQRRGRPRAASFLLVLDEYGRRGDVVNAERIFHEMRKAGYGVLPRCYHPLVYAYINAKAPIDALKERLRRDDIVPDKKLARLLARADALGTGKVT